MMWMTSIFTNWRLILCATAIVLTVILYGWGSHQKSRADKLEMTLDQMRKEAQSYHEKSETIAKEIGDAIPRVVEQAKNEAWKNYVKKYGTGNAACGVRVVGLPTQHNPSEADSTQGTDATRPDSVADPIRSTVEQCAETTVIAVKWQEWAKRNELEVK